MYYNNPAAESESLTWSGNLFMYADTSCPDGWTRASDLDGKFLYGSDTYGNTGGADSHSHGNVSTTSTSISTSEIAGSSSSGTSGTTTSHTHTGLQASVSSNDSLPPYLETILCYKNDFNISSGLISMFNTSTPTGWTRFSSLDNLFVISDSSYGCTGGSTTHSHTATGNTTTDSSANTQNTINPPFSATGGTVTYTDSSGINPRSNPPYEGGYTVHTFTSSGTFTANGSGNVDALVVGGGGSGATSWLEL